MKILDIHTHKPAPQPEAVIAVCIKPGCTPEFASEGQLYSVGVHPWDTASPVPEECFAEIEALACRDDVVAIGECGVDLTPKGGPLFRQLRVMRRQIEISEKVGKPVVIHDVKGHDIIVGMRRDLKPTQNWAIHGFRRKPEVAEMLLKAGCYISFGEEFNPDTVKMMPADRILAETDESQLTIEQVIAKLSMARGEDLTDQIAANSAAFLKLKE